MKVGRARVRRENAGVALLTALGFLFIFGALGVAYVGYMTTSLDRTRVDARTLRTLYLARGGVEVAIGDLQAALSSGKVADVLRAPIEHEFPVYRLDRDAPVGFSAQSERRGIAKVTITDESGKINLNHAPPRILQAILGVDGDTARKIRSALPVQEGAGGAQRWLACPSDLVSRGLINPAAFAALPKRLVTVYSVADHAQPLAFLNLNAAAPEVLAAVLDIPVDAAKTVAAKRPFQSPVDVMAAAGKEPASFNYKPPPDAPDSLPRQLSLESRCFRVVSEAALSDLGPNGVEIRATHRRVEAVVVFDPDGSPQVTFWSEAPERDELPKT